SSELVKRGARRETNPHGCGSASDLVIEPIRVQQEFEKQQIFVGAGQFAALPQGDMPLELAQAGNDAIIQPRVAEAVFGLTPFYLVLGHRSPSPAICGRLYATAGWSTREM